MVGGRASCLRAPCESPVCRGHAPLMVVKLLPRACQGGGWDTPQKPLTCPQAVCQGYFARRALSACHDAWQTDACVRLCGGRDRLGTGARLASLQRYALVLSR